MQKTFVYYKKIGENNRWQDDEYEWVGDDCDFETVVTVNDKDITEALTAILTDDPFVVDVTDSLIKRNEQAEKIVRLFRESGALDYLYERYEEELYRYFEGFIEDERREYESI